MTHVHIKGPLIAGMALWAILALPAVRVGLEARLVTHVFVQLLGLAVVGYLIGMALRPLVLSRLAAWNRFGLSGLAIAISCGAVWMLPRWLDASLESDLVETTKFVSLPLLLGLPLALSWLGLGTILRGFLKANFLSMLLFLGWLYIASPVRLCNSYLIDDQTLLGTAFIAIAGVLSLLWSVPLFLNQHYAETRPLSDTSDTNKDQIYAVRPID